MANKKPIHINQILNLTINRFGKDGDAIFMYRNFIIFLKTKNKLSISLNEFIKIRITKILPTFALAVLVSDNADKANNTQKLNSSVCGDSLDNASVDSNVQKQSSGKPPSITSDTPHERIGVALEAAKVVSTKVPHEGSYSKQNTSQVKE